MKKRISSFCSVLLLLVLFSGCGGMENSSDVCAAALPDTVTVDGIEYEVSPLEATVSESSFAVTGTYQDMES